MNRRRRVLGEDHPATLMSAHSLLFDLTVLGEQQAARELFKDIRTRRGRVHSDDRSDTG